MENKRKDRIALKGMEFFAYHGCLDFEKKLGNRYIVDFECFLDLGKASLSDNLDDTLNYAGIYSIVKYEMSQPSELLENVAYRILSNIKKMFPVIDQASVTVAKLNPPLEGIVERAEVSLSL